MITKKPSLIDDLTTDGKSKVIFIEALKKFEINVSDIFVIFYYDIFDLTNSPLADLNIKMHYLCTWKNIINILQKNKTLTINEIKNLKFFLTETKTWRQMYE